MTDYFEVHSRDGAARIGELRLESSRMTPALIDDLIKDGGSLWSSDREVPVGDPSKITVLPHRGMPSGTPTEIQQAFQPEVPDIDNPSAAVVSEVVPDEQVTDVYILSAPQTLVGHAPSFVDAVISLRDQIPADTALYFPSVATPKNIGILCYAGVDLFDTDRVELQGLQGEYLTVDETIELSELEELPCACSACQQPVEEFGRRDCAEHNKNLLTSQLKRIRRYIKRGQLRDYLEGQTRYKQWHTETLRRFDQQWDYLEQRMPVIRDAEITAATDDTLNRVEIQRFASRVINRYQARLDDHPLVLVPCSAKKPYSTSKSHRQFHDAISYRGHIVTLTSPLGIIPNELELTYPAQHYDTVVTGDWSETEINFVTELLTAYLENTDYPEIIAHAPEDGYKPIIDQAVSTDNVTYTVDGHPTDEQSLANLSAALDGIESYRRERRRKATIQAIADYMFGPGAGDVLFDQIEVQGRYPGLRAINGDGTQLATIVAKYGILSLTLEGAKQWTNSSVPTKYVEIDDFVPHGSVLAPGVVDATDTIRPGDEVIIEGESAFGVGRAEMSGKEMVESIRGVASKVRHIEEQ